MRCLVLGDGLLEARSGLSGRSFRPPEEGYIGLRTGTFAARGEGFVAKCPDSAQSDFSSDSNCIEEERTARRLRAFQQSKVKTLPHIHTTNREGICERGETFAIIHEISNTLSAL